MEKDIQEDLRALKWMEAAIKDLLVSRGTGGEQDTKVAAIKAALIERSAGQGHRKAIVFSAITTTPPSTFTAPWSTTLRLWRP